MALNRRMPKAAEPEQSNPNDVAICRAGIASNEYNYDAADDEVWRIFPGIDEDSLRVRRHHALSRTFYNRADINAHDEEE